MMISPPLRHTCLKPNGPGRDWMSKNIRCLTSFQTCCLLEPVGQQPLIAPGVAKLFSTEAWTTCWCPCLWSWSSLQTQLRPSVHTSSQSVSFRASASPPWHVDRACLMCTKPLHIAAYKQYLRKTSVTLQASELQAAYKLRCHFASCHSMSCHLFSCHVMWFCIFIFDAVRKAAHTTQCRTTITSL